MPQLAGRVQEVPDWAFSYPVASDPGHPWPRLHRLHWLDLLPSLLVLANHRQLNLGMGDKEVFSCSIRRSMTGAKRGEDHR